LGEAEPSSLVLQGELPRPVKLPPLDRVLAHARRNRPDLSAADLAVTAALSRADLADAEARPDVTVGLHYGREELANTIVARVGIELPVFNRNAGARQRARAVVSRLRATRSSLGIAAASEVRAAWIAYDRALGVRQIYTAQVLRAQGESLDLLRRAFEAGDIGISDVVVMQREVLTGRDAHLRAEEALAMAHAALLAAVGVPQHKEFPGELE